MTQNGSGWAIEWECVETCWADDHPVCIDFIIYGSDGGAVIKCGIKWDGCSNWIEPESGYFHLCGLRHVENLYSAMDMCYTIAGKYMPEALE